MRERIVVPPRCPWHWRLWNRPASKWRPSPLRGLLWTMFISAMPGARFAKRIREAPVESAHTFLLYDAAPLSELDAQPLYIAFTLVQPIIWLVLFGQLFKKIVLLPGFGASAYVDFLTPGVVIMTVLFGAGWSGM